MATFELCKLVIPHFDAVNLQTLRGKYMEMLNCKTDGEFMAKVGKMMCDLWMVEQQTENIQQIHDITTILAQKQKLKTNPKISVYDHVTKKHPKFKEDLLSLKPNVILNTIASFLEHKQKIQLGWLNHAIHIATTESGYLSTPPNLCTLKLKRHVLNRILHWIPDHCNTQSHSMPAKLHLYDTFTDEHNKLFQSQWFTKLFSCLNELQCLGSTTLDLIPIANLFKKTKNKQDISYLYIKMDDALQELPFNERLNQFMNGHTDSTTVRRIEHLSIFGCNYRYQTEAQLNIVIGLINAWRDVHDTLEVNAALALCDIPKILHRRLQSIIISDINMIIFDKDINEAKRTFNDNNNSNDNTIRLDTIGTNEKNESNTRQSLYPLLNKIELLQCDKRKFKQFERFLDQLFVEPGLSDQITTLNTGVASGYDEGYLKWQLNKVMGKDSILPNLATNILTIEDDRQLTIFVKILSFFHKNREDLRNYNGKAIVIKVDHFVFDLTTGVKNYFSSELWASHELLKNETKNADYSIENEMIVLNQFDFSRKIVAQTIYNVLDWYQRIEQHDTASMSRSIKLIVHIE